jgi:hypothetical protein
MPLNVANENARRALTSGCCPPGASALEGLAAASRFHWAPQVVEKTAERRSPRLHVWEPARQPRHYHRERSVQGRSVSLTRQQKTAIAATQMSERTIVIFARGPLIGHHVDARHSRSLAWQMACMLAAPARWVRVPCYNLVSRSQSTCLAPVSTGLSLPACGPDACSTPLSAFPPGALWHFLAGSRPQVATAAAALDYN